jgi:hypothetical protein
VALWRSERTAIRKAAATRVLAVFRFFFWRGLPSLIGRRGANVACDTNSFSVGKRLKFGPYSLSTIENMN